MSFLLLLFSTWLISAPADAPAARAAVVKTFVNDWPVPIKLEIKRGDERPCTENRTLQTLDLPPKGRHTVELDPGDCLCYRRTANPGTGSELQLVWSEACSQVTETIVL